MIKRKLLITAVFGVGALLVGCSDDNTVFNEPEVIRAYETDAQVMAQFVEVDRTTGTYVLNRSREELMAVNQINRNRFFKEMEAVNRQLSAAKRSGLASAFVYSTQTSSLVIDGNDDDSFQIAKLDENTNCLSRVASLTLEDGKIRSTRFFTHSDITMTVNSGNGSTFYCAQVSLGDQSNENAEIVFISGVKSFIPAHSYLLIAPAILDGNKTISGISLIGDSNVTVSITL